MIDFIKTCAEFCGYTLITVATVFFVLWILVGLYVVAYDILHATIWKKQDDYDEDEEQWL